MSEVSLKRPFSYFALLDDGLTLKTLKLAYIGFCIQTLKFHFQINEDEFLIIYLAHQRKWEDLEQSGE